VAAAGTLYADDVALAKGEVSAHDAEEDGVDAALSVITLGLAQDAKPIYNHARYLKTPMKGILGNPKVQVFLKVDDLNKGLISAKYVTLKVGGHIIDTYSNLTGEKSTYDEVTAPAPTTSGATP
jgi:hypothetical protein